MGSQEEHKNIGEKQDLMRFLPPKAEKPVNKGEVSEKEESKPRQGIVSFGKENEAVVVNPRKNLDKGQKNHELGNLMTLLRKSQILYVGSEKKRKMTFGDKTNDRTFYDKETLEIWKKSHSKV